MLSLRPLWSLNAVSETTMSRSDGERHVMFFGKALGHIINYSPDSALRCDLDGKPLEVLTKAYRRGKVRLSFGGAPLRRPPCPRCSASVELDEADLCSPRGHQSPIGDTQVPSSKWPEANESGCSAEKELRNENGSNGQTPCRSPVS